MDETAAFAPRARGAPWWAWVAVASLAVTSAYFWVVPLVRPRGAYLWGHYKLVDVYLGVPAGLATLSGIAVLGAPSASWRRTAMGLTVSWFAALVAMAGCDLAYAMVYLGAWWPDVWLDRGYISRKFNSRDTALGFVRRPGIRWRGRAMLDGRYVEYRTDENGFRNARGLERADVVFVGDSFTEAAGILEEDTFVRRLAASSGLGVVNLGRGAYGPQQELIVLERYGLKYSPRFVVWQLFEGNDLADARRYMEWKRNPDRIVAVPFHERYLQNAPVAQLISRTRRPLMQPAPDAVPVTIRFHDGARQVFLRYQFKPQQPAQLPQAWAETRRAIEAGYRLCRARGIEFLVLYVPTMGRVLEPFLTLDGVAGHDRVAPEGAMSDPGDFGTWLAELCAELGCAYVDTFTALRQQAFLDNTRVYDRNDPDEHLDVDGHAVVARAVLEWLRSHRR